MPNSQDFQDRVVVPLRPDRRIASLRTLAEDLLITRAENSSPVNAPALATIYPLQYMESWTLISAFCRWMEIAGEDGVFLEGVHGDSGGLPQQETELFSGYSALIAVDMTLSPSHWPRLHQGRQLRELQDAGIVGERVSDFADPGLRRANDQGLLDQVARGRPSVCRISGVALAGASMFDRLWLPIAEENGRIVRCISLIEPISNIVGHRDY